LPSITNFTVDYRPARPVDADGVQQLLVAAAEEEGSLVEAPDELSVEHLRDRIRQCVSRRGQIFTIAVHDQHVVGMIALEAYPLRALQHLRHLSLVVDPRFRRRGIGRKMLRQALDWARETPEVEKIEVRIREANAAAAALARTAGFEVEGRLKRRVGLPNGRRLDDLEMALFVESPKKTPA
jgi:RimJ/RimL family protein N-acetyltransferase